MSSLAQGASYVVLIIPCLPVKIGVQRRFRVELTVRDQPKFQYLHLYLVGSEAGPREFSSARWITRSIQCQPGKGLTLNNKRAVGR